MRFLYSFFLTTLVLSLLAMPAQANPIPPRQMAEESAQRIMNMLNDPAFQAPETKPAILTKLEDEVLSLFDFEEFSSRTVGPAWKQFTPEQKKAFNTAFTDLLRNTYIDTLDSYHGERIVYTGERSSDGGTRVEVQMNFEAKDKSYPVAFRMLVKNDRWVVYDVIIEGLSMIKNYRDQFRDLLSKNNPDELIAKVEAKAVEQLNKSGKK